MGPYGSKSFTPIGTANTYFCLLSCLNGSYDNVLNKQIYFQQLSHFRFQEYTYVEQKSNNHFYTHRR